jgi:hypothetical protein
MSVEENKNPKVKTYGVMNVVGSVIFLYAIATIFSTQGIYNWSSKLAVTPFTQDLKDWSEFLWASASDYGLEEPRHSLDSWFLALQDAHVLLYPKTYARTQELIQKRRLRRMEKDRIERGNPKLAARILKQKQMMESETEVIKGKRPRVLILGDSIMMTVGPVIKDNVASKMAGSAIVRAKLATGLARPDVFDWNSEIRGVTGKSKFDFIFMMLGTNDSQDFAENGKIFTYGTTEWVDIYNKRLLSVMQTACLGANKVLWFGLPPMKSVNFDRKAHRINSWTKKQAGASGCVEYIPTDRLLGDSEGKFASYLKIGNHIEKIRMVDGIHVTKKGGQVVSDFIVDYVKSQKKSKNPTLAH